MTNDNEKPIICSICKKPIAAQGTWKRGHSAEPVVKDGRCCTSCNVHVVLPARFALVLASRPKRGEHT